MVNTTYRVKLIEVDNLLSGEWAICGLSNERDKCRTLLT